jgi:hypothetical protein
MMPSSCFWERVRRSRSRAVSCQTFVALPGVGSAGPGPGFCTGGCAGPRAGVFRLGAGVGGGVHDGGEVFILVGGGEDFQVVEAMAGFADERALGVAESFFGGFGAVGVEGVGPAAGDAGQEVGVRGGGGVGEVVFDPVQVLRGGVVFEAVQSGADDGPGAG